MRPYLEDRAQGWQRIKSSGHQDKIDGTIIAEAWHSDLLSCEDNQNKQTYAVYCGECDGKETYEFHSRRAQHGSVRQLRQKNGQKVLGGASSC